MITDPASTSIEKYTEEVKRVLYYGTFQGGGFVPHPGIESWVGKIEQAAKHLGRDFDQDSRYVIRYIEQHNDMPSGNLPDVLPTL